MENTMKQMLALMKEKSEVHGQVCVKEEGESSTTENGINVMRIPSQDAYAFGLQLIDILFTKSELASSLLFKSKKSEKPGLDKVRVERMLGYIEKRYGGNWDIKLLTMKANQKCRDSKESFKQDKASGSKEDEKEDGSSD